MGRLPKWRRVAFIPQITRFTPAGVPPESIREVYLSVEEAEAMRLKDLEGLEQEQCAESMRVSRPTFARVLGSARQKMADAVFNGKAIRIEGGNFEMAMRPFRCVQGHRWDVPFETLIAGPPRCCPTCSTPSIMPIHPLDSARTGADREKAAGNGQKSGVPERSGSGVPPIVSIVGKSKSGKTTLIEKLVPELKARGYRVATVKHSHHRLSFDEPGKDSWRHAQAGSDCVVIVSPDKVVLIIPNTGDLALDQITRFLGEDYDIILAEGFKRGDAPKIEVHRREVGPPLTSLANLMAIVTDEPLETRKRQFSLEDIKGLVDLLGKSFLKKKPDHG